MITNTSFCGSYSYLKDGQVYERGDSSIPDKKAQVEFFEKKELSDMASGLSYCNPSIKGDVIEFNNGKYDYRITVNSDDKSVNTLKMEKNITIDGSFFQIIRTMSDKDFTDNYAKMFNAITSAIKEAISLPSLEQAKEVLKAPEKLLHLVNQRIVTVEMGK